MHRLPYIFFLFPWLILHAQQPTLEKVVLFGNSRTKTHIILRELKSSVGKPLLDETLFTDRAWLLRQDFLRRIEFQIKPGSSSESRVLILVVQEKSGWSVSPIVSNQDIYGWYAGSRFTLHNLLGKRNRLDITLQLGGLQRYELIWSNPWITGKWRLFTAISAYQTTFQYRFKDYPTPFDEKDVGMLATLGKGFGRNAKIGFRGGIEKIWADDEAVTFGSNKTDKLAILEAFTEFDSRDWPLYPKTGFYGISWMRWYNPGLEHPFQRLGFDLRAYTPLFRDNIIAGQTYLDIARGNLPVYKRIHIGGGRTIRGYSTGSLSGENLFLISAEYRFPIFYVRNPLAGIHVGYAGVLFFDSAATWYGDQSFGFDKFNSSAGIGIHLIWDNFVLRAEYGYRGKAFGFINIGSGVKF